MSWRVVCFFQQKLFFTFSLQTLIWLTFRCGLFRWRVSCLLKSYWLHSGLPHHIVSSQKLRLYHVMLTALVFNKVRSICHFHETLQKIIFRFGLNRVSKIYVVLGQGPGLQMSPVYNPKLAANFLLIWFSRLAQWFLTRGASRNFKGARALIRPTTWKVSSMYQWMHLVLKLI